MGARGAITSRRGFLQAVVGVAGSTAAPSFLSGCGFGAHVDNTFDRQNLQDPLPSSGSNPPPDAILVGNIPVPPGRSIDAVIPNPLQPQHTYVEFTDKNGQIDSRIHGLGWGIKDNGDIDIIDIHSFWEETRLVCWVTDGRNVPFDQDYILQKDIRDGRLTLEEFTPAVPNALPFGPGKAVFIGQDEDEAQARYLESLKLCALINSHYLEYIMARVIDHGQNSNTITRSVTEVTGAQYTTEMADFYVPGIGRSLTHLHCTSPFLIDPNHPIEKTLKARHQRAEEIVALEDHIFAQHQAILNERDLNATRPATKYENPACRLAS